MFNRKFSLLFAFAASVLLVSGCVQSKKTYTINPDCSGKVVFSVATPNMMAMMGGGQNTQPADQQINSAIGQLINGSKGVDAWKDLNGKINEKGSVVVTGTAYFPDFNKVNIGGMENLLSVEKTDNGTKISIRADKDMNPMADKMPGGKKVSDMSDEELKAMLQQQKAQIMQMKMLMGSMLNEFSDIQEFYLPGEMQDVKGLSKTEDGKGVFSTLEGKKALAGMESLMNDEELMLRIMKKDTENADTEELMNDPDLKVFMQKVFGFSDIPVANFNGTEPQFDYASESAAAKAEWEKVKDKYPAPAMGMPGMQFGQ